MNLIERYNRMESHKKILLRRKLLEGKLYKLEQEYKKCYPNVDTYSDRTPETIMELILETKTKIEDIERILNNNNNY